MKITSNKVHNAILAADEDPFADMDFEDEGGEDFGEDVESEGTETPADSLDDMADTLDEMNDVLQGIEEDEVDIEINNNIDNHYIAECDRCHNVFITSVVLSDQKVEKLSGICPVCDEESDQYLKWIIKDINEIEI